MQTFARVDAAPEAWLVISGRLDHDGAYAIPDFDSVPPDLPPVLARFSGMGLSEGGFDRPVSAQIAMQPVCYGSWCGGFPAPGEALLFVQVQEDGSYLLPLDPCGQHAFPPPDSGVIAALTSCASGQGCVTMP